MVEPVIALTTSAADLNSVITNFIIDRQARGLSANSIRFYRDELSLFTRWAVGQGIKEFPDVTADVLRAWFVDLADRRNKGGVHTSYRALKACLNWLELEEDGDYSNPIGKVKIASPKVIARAGVSIEDIQRMIDHCRSDLAVRDQAILRVFLDTGARAFEFVALNLGDLELVTGAVKILRGKGDKERTVYIGSHSRRALKRYLKTRTHLNLSAPLWLTDEDERLSKRGLRSIIERRANDAGVPVPGLHDFRRAFALNMWRNGVDLLAISRLMGHTSIEVTKRYIKPEESDLRESHAKGSPVDNADL